MFCFKITMNLCSKYQNITFCRYATKLLIYAVNHEKYCMFWKHIAKHKFCRKIILNLCSQQRKILCVLEMNLKQESKVLLLNREVYPVSLKKHSIASLTSSILAVSQRGEKFLLLFAMKYLHTYIISLKEKIHIFKIIYQKFVDFVVQQ